MKYARYFIYYYYHYVSKCKKEKCIWKIFIKYTQIRQSNTNTNTNISFCGLSNTNTNTNTDICVFKYKYKYKYVFDPSPELCHLYAWVNWVIISSGNGLSPLRRQAITWANAGLLSIGLLGTNFNEIRIGILSFSFKKMHLKLSSANIAAILSRGRWVKGGWEPNAISWEAATVRTQGQAHFTRNLIRKGDRTNLLFWPENLMSTNRLLHSLGLVAVGVMLGNETLLANGWCHCLCGWLVSYKMGDTHRSSAFLFSCNALWAHSTGRNYHCFSERTFTIPCSALIAGGLCKGCARRLWKSLAHYRCSCSYPVC